MKSLVIISLLLSFLSCNSQNKETANHERLINGILSEDRDSLVLDDGVIIFCKSNDKNKIGYMTVYSLQKTFNNESRYKNMNSRRFVIDVINGKESFNCDFIIKCFILNDTIKTFYESNSFSKFLTNYCITQDNIEYSFKDKLSFEAEMTVIFYLYQNNYYTSFSDIAGAYYSSKIDHLLIKKSEELFF